MATKKLQLLAKLMVGICLIIISVSATTAFAVTPIFTIRSSVLPTKIVKNRTAIAQYTVTNTSGVTLNNDGAVDLPSGANQYTGTGLCTNPFDLNNNANCTLQLNLTRSTAGSIQGGPKICHTPTHQAYCSLPPSNERLNVQVVDTPSGDMPTLTLSPSSELILIPGTAVDLTVTNTSTTTAANNVDITLPSNIESEVDTKTRTGCDNIAAGGTCTISLTAKTGAAIDPFPQPATVQGANTQTANIDVDIQGEVTGSTVTFSSPGAQNLTLTNNSSSDVTVNSVTLSSGINNVTVGSLSDCQPLAASSTCNVPLTAVQTSYGSGTATVTYNTTRTVTPAPEVVVDNTTLSISNEINLQQNQSGQNFTVTNNGNFTWQNADFSLATSLTGVTPDYSDCTSTPLTPTNSCTITFNTSGAVEGDNTILSTTGDNIDTYSSNVTVVGSFVVEVDTDANNINLGYRALKATNDSVTLTGRITDVTSSVPTKIHFCANGDTSCTHQSTCVLDQDIPAGSDCLIWLKALDADQSLETADVDVTVDGNYPTSTTGKNSHHKINAAFSHVFTVAYSKSLFAGGYFTTAGGITVNRIAKWDGSSWSALVSGAETGVNSGVLAFSNDSSGNLYVGGQFTTAGGINPINYIAKWNGAAWSALTSGSQTGVNNYVRALTNDSSGNVYVGGYFTTAGEINPINYIAKWDGSAWSALASGGVTGTGNTVYALTNDNSGNIYAGGFFTTAGEINPVNYIAKWNGSAWSALASGGVTGTNSYVYTLTIDGLGQLYAGGQFSSAGGIGVNKIAKWDGSTWSALASGAQTGTDDNVYALTTDNSDNIYAGGEFTTAGGMTVNNIAKWNDSTSTWSALASGAQTGVNNAVRALTNDTSGDLYAGGYFTTAGGMTVNRIAKWDGSAWSALVSGGQTGVNNDVYAPLYVLPIIESITAVSTTTPRFKFKHKVLKPGNKHHIQKHRKYK